jgi:mannitol-1-phosphate 5-dehydrogenase
LSTKRIFVGFGFGAIQAGLFLYEAFRSGNFDRYIIAEVLPDVVESIRQAGGVYRVNIAHADHIEHAEVGPVKIENPAVEADRQRLIAAIAEAEEIATAIPSVRYYTSDGPGSLHRILAQGLREKARLDGPRTVVYAAENNNHAAELLEKAVFGEIPAGEQQAVREKVQFLNTVIGKMSGIKTDPAEIEAQGLAAMTPDARRAFLVEAFNRILISKIEFAPQPGASPYQRGIEVFVEKANLLPFEEAKLYGHNAVHALAAYLGALQDVKLIADLRQPPDMMAFLRSAFIEEAGRALIRKHGGVDPLFTPKGFQDYADDLLARMTNPFLGDTVERVGRDPGRKLGWEDRLVGTIRLALKQGVEPQRFALGAAAALAMLDPQTLADDSHARTVLAGLWREAAPDPQEAAQVWDWIRTGQRKLREESKRNRGVTGSQLTPPSSI